MRDPDLQGYGRYLIPGERVVVALHRHWAIIVRPAAASVAGLVLATWVDIVAPPGAQLVSTTVWWLWLVSAAVVAWRAFEWRREWFLATDKRLILTSGLISRNVAMMPLAKVTDLSYVRSPLGRVLGYGRFVLESAGQEQALREVNWIPHPDATYRVICAEIFGTSDPDDGEYDEPDEGLGDDALPWAPEWLTTEPSEVVTPAHRTADHSRAVPVTPVHGPAPEGEPLYVSDDIARRQRADDTGPIHRYDV